MSSAPAAKRAVRRSGPRRGEPVWEIAHLYPGQGEWTEEEYLSLDTNQLIDFVDGWLEFPDMPTVLHQLIAQFLFRLLDTWAAENKAGEAFMSPLRVKLFRDRIRQPDICLIRQERILDLIKPPRGADLVMEVVSGGKANRQRDLVTKRREYARAGVQEYWIVDTELQTITVLVLSGKRYRKHGIFKPGATATSVLLSGFAVDVSAVFAAGEGKRK
jgi:Uma2 family endonuclease